MPSYRHTARWGRARWGLAEYGRSQFMEPPGGGGGGHPGGEPGDPDHDSSGGSGRPPVICNLQADGVGHAQILRTKVFRRAFIQADGHCTAEILTSAGFVGMTCLVAKGDIPEGAVAGSIIFDAPTAH